MYEDLRGKKLLVIGSGEVDANIVRAAHELGVYVIVADGVQKSPATFAKNIADESWDINYAHIEELGERCRAAGVDGVLAGYSEFRVSAACRIAAFIGSPFYATLEQIELTRNKRRFKDTCRRYGVRTPRDYCIDRFPGVGMLPELRLPVIVKPTDAAGRKGITVCTREEELPAAVELAIQNSVSGTVIVEEYVVGREFVAVYTLQDGRYSLSCFNEKYLNEEARSSGLCDLALTPSKHLETYLRDTDPHIKVFLRGIGAQNGVAFFQGIAAEDGCCVFEMGYRLNGGNDYFIAERENGISYMKMLIAHSLTGVMQGALDRDDPFFRKYYANYLLYAHAGRIGRISFNGDENRSGLEDIHVKMAEGMTIREDGTTQQCAFTFKLSAETMEELKELITYCQSCAAVEDETGRNLLFRPFDPGILPEH